MLGGIHPALTANLDLPRLSKEDLKIEREPPFIALLFWDSNARYKACRLIPYCNTFDLCADRLAKDLGCSESLRLIVLGLIVRNNLDTSVEGIVVGVFPHNIPFDLDVISGNVWDKLLEHAKLSQTPSSI